MTVQQDVRRHYNQPQSSERIKGFYFILTSHCSLVGLRNIYTSIAKKRIEAHARHDVGVLQCYAGANHWRLTEPFEVLATLCLACQYLYRMTLYRGD